MAELEETGEKDNWWIELLGEKKCQSTDSGISPHVSEPLLIYQDENELKKGEVAHKTLPPFYKLITSTCYMDYAMLTRPRGLKDYSKTKRDLSILFFKGFNMFK